MADPIKSLKGLKQLGLFYNKLNSPTHVLKLLESLPKLKEVSLDGNPCAKEQEFCYELILRMPNIKMLNEEAVKDLEHDVATQYF